MYPSKCSCAVLPRISKMIIPIVTLMFKTSLTIFLYALWPRLDCSDYAIACTTRRYYIIVQNSIYLPFWKKVNSNEQYAYIDAYTYKTNLIISRIWVPCTYPK